MSRISLAPSLCDHLQQVSREPLLRNEKWPSGGPLYTGRPNGPQWKVRNVEAGLAL